METGRRPDRSSALIVVERLSQLKAGEDGRGACIHAHCRACNHFAKLDVPALLESRGDLTFDQVKARLRCQVCGGRRVALVHGWSTGPLGYRS